MHECVCERASYRKSGNHFQLFEKGQKRKCKRTWVRLCANGSLVLSLETKWGGRIAKDRKKHCDAKCVFVRLRGGLQHSDRAEESVRGAMLERARGGRKRMNVSDAGWEWQARRGWDHSLAAPCSNYNILCLVRAWMLFVCVCHWLDMYKWSCSGDFRRHVCSLNYASFSVLPAWNCPLLLCWNWVGFSCSCCNTQMFWTQLYTSGRSCFELAWLCVFDLFSLV